MQATTTSLDYIPRKTTLGAELLAVRDASLTYTMRRVLLLADGIRTVGALIQMLPGQNVVAELNTLVDRGLAEVSTAEQIAASRAMPGAAASLSSDWMTASNFMMARARESLGVMAADVIRDLERAQDEETARQAMSHWYKALRGSRNTREQADALRVEASRLMRGTLGQRI